MNSETVFVVRDVIKDKSGKVMIVGFPETGSTIRLGDKFTSMYEVPRTLEDVLNERPIAKPINSCSLALTVIAINSMRRPIDVLPAGVTGALYLSGEGVEHVNKGTFLKA